MASCRLPLSFRRAKQKACTNALISSPQLVPRALSFDVRDVRQKLFFTITAEIHARSLANFYCQYADKHKKFEIHATRQPARAGNSAICYQFVVEFRHHIVKVVYSYFDNVMTKFMINNRPDA